MLSFRSQMKLIPVTLSRVASEGKLGKRHPDSISNTLEKSRLDAIQSHRRESITNNFSFSFFFFLWGDDKKQCNISNKGF